MRTFGVRRMRATVVAALAMLLVLAVPAHAHGRLKSSSPASGAHLGRIPSQLRLDFSETPELAVSWVRLFTADSIEIPLGTAVYAPDSRRSIIAPVAGVLRAGIYVVMWQMAGDDGHPVRGKYDFVIAPGAIGIGEARIGAGAPSVPAGGAHSGDMLGMHHDPITMPEGNGFGAGSPLYVIVRWLEFVSLLLVIGAVAFRAFVLRSLRGSGPANGLVDTSMMTSAAEASAARIGLAASLGLATSLPLRLLAQSYAMHGASDAWNVRLVWQLLRRTLWGHGWLMQLTGVMLAGVAFFLAARAPRRHAGDGTREGRRSSIQWSLAAVGAIACAWSLAYSGHAASVPAYRALALLADGLHVLGASTWLGTLAVVLMAGIPAALRQESEAQGALVRSLVGAFSPVALVGAALAAVTGVIAAWLHVGTIPNLWGTRYGITLLTKLAVLGVVALTGFYNWRFVQPRLGTGEVTMKLRRSARVEVAVAILVLLVTAVLVAVPTSMDSAM